MHLGIEIAPVCTNELSNAESKMRNSIKWANAASFCLFSFFSNENYTK